MDEKLLQKDYSKLKVEPTVSDKISSDDQSSLVEQIREEYKLAYEHLVNKILVGGKRLKLYNNQRKNPESVGDTSLYTIMNTLLAQVYFDRISVNFKGFEIGDDEIADNLNALARYDYVKSKKYILDYHWDWSALFFGSAPLLMPGLDRVNLLPIHKLYDPLTFLRDPDATVVNSFGGLKGAGYFGSIIHLSKSKIKNDPAYIQENIDNNDESTFVDKDLANLIGQAKVDRDVAQGRETTEKSTGDTLEVLEWHTIFKGKRCRVNLCGEDFDKVIRFNYLINSENEYEDEWRLVLRQFSPMPMDWDGVSVPDFVEDKQRARARVMNLALDNVEDTQRQSYLYNLDSGIDKKALQSYAFNKYVGARGPLSNVIQPIQKNAIRTDLVEYILKTFEDLQERASASPALQQGQQQGTDRTLGELEMVAAGSMNRYKLFGTIFSWSEKQYYELYYYILKNEFQSGIDVKTIRLKSPFGTQTRKLRRENIISKTDPDIEVESVTESVQRKTIARQNKMAFFQLASQLPDSDIKFMIQNIGEDFGIDKQELDYMIPTNAFEYQAQQENIILSNNQTVEISPDDDDDIHIRENSKATSCPATQAHIFAHMRQKMLKVTKPELFPKLQQQQQNMQQQVPSGQGMPAENQLTPAQAVKGIPFNSQN